MSGSTTGTSAIANLSGDSVRVSETPEMCASADQITLSDCVDPIDIEECLSSRRRGSFGASKELTSPRRALIDFPVDDYDVKVVRRVGQPAGAPWPTSIDLISLSPKTRQFLTSYSADMSIVQRKFDECGTAAVYEQNVAQRGAIVAALAEQEYEQCGDTANSQRQSVGLLHSL